MKLIEILTEEKEFLLSELTYQDMISTFGKDSRVSLPTDTDEMIQMNNEDDFNSWKKSTLDKYGDGKVVLDNNAEWYNKVDFQNNKFKKAQDNFASGKKDFLDK